MPQVQEGNTVKVHYTGKFVDGTQFDTSTERGPLEFTMGEGQVIPGFEQAISGMSPGETKTVTIAPDEAYGPHREEMVLEIERDQFPPNLDPEVGQQLELHQPNGSVIGVRVTDVSDDNVTLDANHPLAGQELVFDIELVEIA